jgi:hypothetical protein
MFFRNTDRHTNQVKRHHAAFLLIFCALGCQQQPDASSRLPTFPVFGTITIDGAAPVGAMVKFYSENPGQRMPTAIVREDGSFAASYYDSEDGAPAGEYRLLVVWMQTPPQGGLAQDRLRGQFLDPSHPIATVNVLEGENRLTPIELTIKQPGPR